MSASLPAACSDLLGSLVDLDRGLDSAEETSLASRTQVVSGASMRPASARPPARPDGKWACECACAPIAPASERASRQAPDDARMCQPRRERRFHDFGRREPACHPARIPGPAASKSDALLVDVDRSADPVVDWVLGHEFAWQAYTQRNCSHAGASNDLAAAVGDPDCPVGRHLVCRRSSAMLAGGKLKRSV